METLLLVDEDPELQNNLRHILQSSEWEIESIQSNADALSRVQSKAYGLVITGATTSGQDDVELLREIRQARPHTKVIILTGKSTPEDVVAAIREHAFSYFSKPFSFDALAAIVRIAVEGPSWDDGIELLSGKPSWISLQARCNFSTAERLLQFVREIKADMPKDEREAVGCAFRELLMNAIEHGGHLDPEQYVEISYIRAKHAVLCRIKDPGPGFAQGELPHSALSNPAEDPLFHAKYREAQGLRPGGFGLLLAQKLVDEVTYNQQGNEALLIKYLRH
ncbi:MAG: ATP-binding protein [Acidobacteriaceae bacterium]|nr:ATP-binding protein [Acidobacteriaceae bacterium]